MERTYEQLLVNNKNEYCFHEISDTRNFEKIKKSWKEQRLRYPNAISDVISLVERMMNFTDSDKSISDRFDINFKVDNDISDLGEHELVEEFNRIINEFNRNEISWKEVKKFIENTWIDISDVIINFEQNDSFLFRLKILGNEGLILIEKFKDSSEINKELENVKSLIIEEFLKEEK